MACRPQHGPRVDHRSTDDVIGALDLDLAGRHIDFESCHALWRRSPDYAADQPHQATGKRRSPRLRQCGRTRYLLMPSSGPCLFGYPSPHSARPASSRRLRQSRPRGVVPSEQSRDDKFSQQYEDKGRGQRGPTEHCPAKGRSPDLAFERSTEDPRAQGSPRPSSRTSCVALAQRAPLPHPGAMKTRSSSIPTLACRVAGGGAHVYSNLCCSRDISAESLPRILCRHATALRSSTNSVRM